MQNWEVSNTTIIVATNITSTAAQWEEYFVTADNTNALFNPPKPRTYLSHQTSITKQIAVVLSLSLSSNFNNETNRCCAQPISVIELQ